MPQAWNRCKEQIVAEVKAACAGRREREAGQAALVRDVVGGAVQSAINPRRGRQI